MLKKLIETSGQVLFSDRDKQLFQEYLTTHTQIPKDQLEAISLNHREHELLHQIQTVDQNQKEFTNEILAAVEQVFKKFGLVDLPEEYIQEVVSLLLPQQQNLDEAPPAVQDKKEKLPYELTPLQIRMARAMFRLTGEDAATVLSLRGSIRHEFAAEIAHVPEELRDTEVEKWVQSFWPAKKPLLSKADAALQAMGITEFDQPLSVTEDHWSQLPDNTPIKQILQNALQTPGLQGFSWEELKFILGKVGDVYLDDPEKNREILSKKKPATDNS